MIFLCTFVHSPVSNLSSHIPGLKSIHLSVVFIHFIKSHLHQLLSSLFKHSLVQECYLIDSFPLSPPVSHLRSEIQHRRPKFLEIVCLKRTKQAILNIPKKIEKAIIVSMAEHWEQFSKDLHKEFIHLFGRIWTAGAWNPADLLRSLQGEHFGDVDFVKLTGELSEFRGAPMHRLYEEMFLDITSVSEEHLILSKSSISSERISSSGKVSCLFFWR
ncbi:uncharacterized protein VP01_3578g1 [Puccinia sorghi]|uniref:Uncharacterized protein n=1 Tax=Puccinia sorghi TaxID=27349 RepID=A0A0L6UV78_9BASI|nr:uncharacterized protein VP01_3578g1 [Puccinia sorghi]